MGYSIKPFNDQDRLPELIELFRTGLGDTTVAHWKWRLFSENGAEDQPIAIVIEDDDGKMAAVSSILPVMYGDAGSERKCIQFCDWVVHPAHRGQGLIRKLYHYCVDYYTEKGYDFIIEYPNDHSYPIFLKYGFHEEPRIGCWNSPKKLIARCKECKDTTVQQIQIKFTRTCPLSSEVFTSCDRIVRSPAFLRWKFDQNPDTDHQWVSFWLEGNCLGYIVYTLTKGRFRTAVNVYDWTYRSDHCRPFAEAIRQLSRLGSWVSVWGRYSQSDQVLLEQAGLRPVGGETRLLLKAISSKGWPDQLTLTRIDTDY